MKKIGIGIVGIISIIMLITACVSGGGTPRVSGADELDAAVREASDYLNTKIPNGNKVAFINISGGFPDLANYIIDDLSKHGVNDGVFSVVDRAQLDEVRAELNFNMSGEVSDSSAQEIGKMLGAQTIVSGSVQRVGALYRLTVKAIEVQTAAVQGQWNRNIPNGATIAALTANTSGGTASGGRSGGTATSGGETTQTAARTKAEGLSATTSPPAGKYTFWPRPQVYKRGMPEPEWLYQIVVRGKNMLIYVGNTQRGPSTVDLDGWGESGTILTNLDNPSRSWGHIGYSRPQNFSEGGTVLSFENVTGFRFSLEHTYWSIIIEEIDLSKAEYEQ